jgi:hypothetical protein
MTTRLEAREQARRRLLGPPSKSLLTRAWAFSDGGVLRDRDAMRVRDEQFQRALSDGGARGVELDFKDEAVARVFWQRAWRLAFEEGLATARREG